jgi:hypothetical protein
MSDILEGYTKEITKVFSEQLKSVVLYGSRASGENTNALSGHNILIISENITLDKLAGLSPATKKWLKSGNPPPAIFTVEEFFASADVFPIEFLDMKDNSKLLYGQDFLTSLPVERANIRHQIEFDLRSKLLKLRQAYISLQGNDKQLKAMLMDSISSILSVLRHAVVLFGKESPANKFDSLDMLAGITGVNIDAFKSIYNMRLGDKDALKADTTAIAAQYISGIENIIRAIDSL